MGKSKKFKKKENLLLKIVSPGNKRPLFISCVAIALLVGVAYVTYSLAASTNKYVYRQYGNTKPTSIPKGKCNFSNGYPTLRIGSSGNCVKALQWYLNQADNPKPHGLPKVCKKGAGLTIDGKFGQATYNAVRSYQSSHYTYPKAKLAVDGVVGPKTWQSLEMYREFARSKACK